MVTKRDRPSGSKIFVISAIFRAKSQSLIRRDIQRTVFKAAKENLCCGFCPNKTTSKPQNKQRRSTHRVIV